MAAATENTPDSGPKPGSRRSHFDYDVYFAQNVLASAEMAEIDPSTYT
jgi:hypothetical protein